MVNKNRSGYRKDNLCDSTVRYGIFFSKKGKVLRSRKLFASSFRGFGKNSKNQKNASDKKWENILILTASAISLVTLSFFLKSQPDEQSEVPQTPVYTAVLVEKNEPPKWAKKGKIGDRGDKERTVDYSGLRNYYQNLSREALHKEMGQIFSSPLSDDKKEPRLTILSNVYNEKMEERERQLSEQKSTTASLEKSKLISSKLPVTVKNVDKNVLPVKQNGNQSVGLKDRISTQFQFDGSTAFVLSRENGSREYNFEPANVVPTHNVWQLARFYLENGLSQTSSFQALLQKHGIHIEPRLKVYCNLTNCRNAQASQQVLGFDLLPLELKTIYYHEGKHENQTVQYGLEYQLKSSARGLTPHCEAFFSYQIGQETDYFVRFRMALTHLTNSKTRYIPSLSVNFPIKRGFRSYEKLRGGGTERYKTEQLVFLIAH